MRLGLLRTLVKHAEKFGTAEVYETATAMGFSALELGYLVRHLRRIDKSWRLESAQRTRLVRELLEANVADKEIRDMAGVSQDTVARLRKGREPADPGVENGSTIGREVRRLSWDKECPYQTIYAYFSPTERRSWPRPEELSGSEPPSEKPPRILLGTPDRR